MKSEADAMQALHDEAAWLRPGGVVCKAIATFSERGIDIVTIDPGPVCCSACGGDLVDGPGCNVCGERYEEEAEEA